MCIEVGQVNQLKYIENSLLVQINGLFPLDGKTLSFNYGYIEFAENSRKRIMKGKNLKKLAKSNARVSIQVDLEFSSVVEEQNFVNHIEDDTGKDILAFSFSVDMMRRRALSCVLHSRKHRFLELL